MNQDQEHNLSFFFYRLCVHNKKKEQFYKNTKFIFCSKFKNNLSLSRRKKSQILS